MSRPAPEAADGLAVGISIGALCRRLDVTPRALRLYEERGMVVARRNRRGGRVYDPEAVARVSLIVALRQLDYGLWEIGKVIGLAGEARDRVVAEKLSELRRRKERELAYLDKALDALAQGRGLVQRLSMFTGPSDGAGPSEHRLIDPDPKLDPIY